MPLGLLELPAWGHVLVALVLTHVTIVAVTVFLHRHQAHRALALHPAVSHFFRFWLWLTTGMATRAWVAIHRKHHAKCDVAGDPHSPQVYGIWKVLLEGAELYRLESRNAWTLERYGHDTPDDWMERNVYERHGVLGVSLMLVIDVVLLGPIGLTVWAVQMAWIPLFAAGVINGVGHYWGYRNFAPHDASRNIVPWGLVIGGEELHNNHHAYVTSARFSSSWWEVDIGWMYIRILQGLGLAKVLRVAPRIRLEPGKVRCDVNTLMSVITHRYAVLAQFDKCSKRVVPGDTHRLWPGVTTMRQELAALWSGPTDSKEQLVRQLEDWCRRAEASGIGALQEFSRRLRRYA